MNFCTDIQTIGWIDMKFGMDIQKMKSNDFGHPWLFLLRPQQVEIFSYPVKYLNNY